MNIEKVKEQWNKASQWYLTVDAPARVLEMSEHEKLARKRGFIRLRSLLAEWREKKNWEKFLTIG